MSAATPKQLEVLTYVAAYIRQRGYPPTVREITEGINLYSTNAVSERLDALERKGLIERAGPGRRSRALTVTDRGLQSLGFRQGSCVMCGGHP